MTFRVFFGSLLVKWRFLLIVTLLAGLIIAGSRLISISNNSNNNETTRFDDFTAELEVYKAEMSRMEFDIRLSENALREAEEYTNESLLLHLDPYNIKYEQMSFYVKADVLLDNDSAEFKTNSILRCYYALLQRSNLEEIFQRTALENSKDRYIRELIRLDDVGGGVLSIVAYEPDIISASEIIEIIYDYFKESQQEISAIAYPHTLSVLSVSRQTTKDTGLAVALATAIEAPSILSKALNEKINAKDSMLEPQQSTSSQLFSSGLRYGILGCGIGFFIGVILIFLLTSMSNKVTDGLELSQVLNCRYLGNIASFRPPRGLSMLGNKLCGEDVFASIPTEERFSILAANLNEALGDKGKVFITGDVSQAQLSALVYRLRSVIGSEIIITAGENLLINTHSIDLLNESENVVLLSVSKKTTIDNVKLYSQRICDANKCLLGIVMV